MGYQASNPQDLALLNAAHELLTTNPALQTLSTADMTTNQFLVLSEVPPLAMSFMILP
jgi:hypothetical protein